MVEMVCSVYGFKDTIEAKDNNFYYHNIDKISTTPDKQTIFWVIYEDEKTLIFE
jgi:hypothetical protein